MQRDGLNGTSRLPQNTFLIDSITIIGRLVLLQMPTVSNLILLYGNISKNHLFTTIGEEIAEVGEINTANSCHRTI